VARLWNERLSDDLAGVYLIGSLAHGGFSARYSDIDMAIIVRRPLAAPDLEQIGVQMAAQWPDLAPKLSLFWSDDAFLTGRFPPLDRIDYLDHGAPLIERRRVRPERPTLPDVRRYLRGDPLATWSRRTLLLSEHRGLHDGDHKVYLRALLYPARFIYSWDTGKVASNDDAVGYVEARNIPGFDIDLVKRALRCRNAGEDLLPLFPERHKLPDLARICAEYAAAWSGRGEY